MHQKVLSSQRGSGVLAGDPHGTEAVATKQPQDAAAAMHFTLPYPPSANRYWRSYRGIMVTSPQALEYKAVARHIAGGMGYAAFTEKVVVAVDIYRPAKRGDLDNTLKVLLDSLNGIAYVDDSQIVEIRARRFDDKKNPRAEVTVKARMKDEL